MNDTPSSTNGSTPGYTLRPGWAFAVERDGASQSWRATPDAAWENVLVGDEETGACTCVGFRQIDGAHCAVFVAPAGREHAFYAQTSVYCRNGAGGA